MEISSLKRIDLRCKVDIKFRDVSFSVYSGREEKVILNKVSGNLPGGKLTAILGTSGSGKTTLMNYLSGFKTNGVYGKVYVNGHQRRLSQFRKISCFIHQDDLVISFLTVQQVMIHTARLKLGGQYSIPECQQIVDEILDALRLMKCKNTLTTALSGGQRRRLNIGLELLSNPLVLFLDEPTTGLDSSTSLQCIQLLKSLAKRGHTIVCTIHQPSTKILELFDHVYLIAKGNCVYNGPMNVMIRHFEMMGYSCPTTHNPVDFVIETTHTMSNSQLIDFSSKIQFQDGAEISQEKFQLICSKSTALPEYKQFMLLLRQKIIQTLRNRLMLLMLFTCNILVGLTIGLGFFNTGSSSEHVLVQFTFVLTLVISVSYSNAMIPILTYPEEVELLKRQYFNGWFSFRSYYLANTLSRVIYLFFFVISALLAYWLADHPMEAGRLGPFMLVLFLISAITDAYGLLVGSIFRPKVGAIFGPCSLAPVFMVCFLTMRGTTQSQLYVRILMITSYMRLSMMAMMQALLADREPLKCKLEFCYYRRPSLLLMDTGADEIPYSWAIIGMLIILICIRMLGILFLRMTLFDNFNKIKIFIQREFIKTLRKVKS